MAKITEEVKELIVTLREQGNTSRRIRAILAADHGVELSHQAITWVCVCEAADPPHLATKPPKEWTGKMDCIRNGVVVRRFSKEEDRELLRLEREGLNYTEIGRKIGRVRRSVEARLITLARAEARRDGKLEALQVQR